MRFMNLNYIKRFRMELNLRRWQPMAVMIPEGYRLTAWSSELTPIHAEVKYQSFCGELDAQIFPCLGNREGCLRLMREIESKDGFLPEGTWLAEYFSPLSNKTEYCGTIQAVRTHRSKASFQNIGVTPFHRHRGVGIALIQAALCGLKLLNLSRACLEVTAENEGAIRLYRRLGFRTARTLYKTIELAQTAPAS